MTNQELRALYERVYTRGQETFFTFPTEDVSEEVRRELDWEGLEVLEVGCGSGHTSALLAEAGARVLAVDYVESAVAQARARYRHRNLRFEVMSFEDVTGDYDAIVAQEVIEHTDDPLEFLRRMKQCLRPDGRIVVTCPNFTNIRGVVWMTLQVLLEVPMSLTDKHFICPFDMEKWSQELGLECCWRTFRHGQAHGEDLVLDFRKRLTNALRDANLDNSRVDRFLYWLDRSRRYDADSVSNGAKALYRLQRRSSTTDSAPRGESGCASLSQSSTPPS